jgi:predicted CoA-binding protein
MKKTLVVGARTNPERYAYKAIHLLRSNQHPVLAFGLKTGLVADITIQTEIPQESIDTITLYVGPDRQGELIAPLLALSPKRIIFNPGTENPAFIEQARLAGVETEIACTLVLLSTGAY